MVNTYRIMMDFSADLTYSVKYTLTDSIRKDREIFNYVVDLMEYKKMGFRG